MVLNQRRNGVADLPPAREIPFVREIPALQWPHRIHRAVIALEKKTVAVRFVLESQAVSLRTDAGVALDEVVLIELKILGDTGDLLFANLHLSGPAATRSA